MSTAQRAVGLALALLAGLASLPAAAAELRLDGQLVQGGLIIGAAEAGAAVRLDGRNVRVAPDGGFVIGFGRDADPAARLDIDWPDGRRETRPLAIAKRQFDIQRIDGLPDAMVSPPAAVLQRIKDETAKVRAARAIDTPRQDFRAGFVWPADGPISGVYGSQRILNGELRQPHFGLDIAAPEGAPVRAAAGGVVTLAADLYFTGLTVIIEHGHGVSSTYSHLSRMDVKPGRAVASGERIGAVGRTGRATGAHLDWRINWLDVRIDPALVVPPR